MGDIFLEVGLADWLNLTTFSEHDLHFFQQYFDDVSALFELDPQETTIRGYQGLILLPSDGGSIFFGVGRQNGLPHALLSVAGYLSDAALVYDFGTAKCSRIDLQMTIPRPGGYSARKLKDKIEKQLEGSHNRELRSVSLVEGQPKGYDTVYLGSRKSERFSRFYVKQLDDGDYLRYEVEFKGQVARAVYREVKADPDSKAPILLAEWKKTGRVQDRAWEAIGGHLEGIVAKEIKGPKKSSTIEKRSRWYTSQVFPALEKDLRDDDIGEYLASLLRKMLLLRDGVIEDNIDLD